MGRHSGREQDLAGELKADAEHAVSWAAATRKRSLGVCACCLRPAWYRLDRHALRARDWVARWCAAAGGLLFVIAHRSMGDDSYITLDYARNLALHGHWGVLANRPSNTATSPVNMWLLAALIAITRAPVIAVGLLLMATLAVAGTWLCQLSRVLGAAPRLTPVLGLGLLVSSPLLVSTIGLETYLAITLLIGLVRYAAAGRWATADVIGGLLLLTRPDLAVFIAAVGLILVWRHPRPMRSLLLGLGTLVAVAAPWPVVSWFVLGSALPDSLVAKAGGGAWGGKWFFADAPVYYFRFYPAASTLTVAAAGLGLVGLLWLAIAAKSDRALRLPLAMCAALCAAGTVHILLIWRINTGPFHWYFCPLLLSFGLAAVVAAGLAAQRRRSRVRLAPAVALGAVLGASLGFDLHHDGGIWQTAPIRTNWATTSEYAAIGDWIARNHPGATITSPGEVGTIAYFCNCNLVDYLSRPGIHRGRQASGRCGSTTSITPCGWCSDQLVEPHWPAPGHPRCRRCRMPVTTPKGTTASSGRAPTASIGRKTTAASSNTTNRPEDAGSAAPDTDRVADKCNQLHNAGPMQTT